MIYYAVSILRQTRPVGGTVLFAVAAGRKAEVSRGDELQSRIACEAPGMAVHLVICRINNQLRLPSFLEWLNLTRIDVKLNKSMIGWLDEIYEVSRTTVASACLLRLA